MDEKRFDAISRLIARLTSRRSAMQSLGAAGVGAGLGGLVPGWDDAEARKKRKKKKHKNKKGKCKPPKGKCGGKCIALNTNEHCGKCGNACTGDATCRGDVCCASELCRGECRPDCPPPSANFPFPQHITDTAGSIKPTQFNQGQLDDQVRTAYGRWKDRYLVTDDRDAEGHQVFRIAFGKPGTNNHKQTVSEGQGYGMVIVAIMAGYDPEAQEIFDGLWRFRLAHPSIIDDRLMDWKVPGSKGDGDDSAFDGDADIAYALLLADAQWGSGDPNHLNYAAEADWVISGIWESTIGLQSKLPMLGYWVKGEPDTAKYNQYTPRTSDFMPGHFKAFGAATGNGNGWQEVVDACQNVITTLQEDFSQNNDPDGPVLTGLLPDFVQPVSAADHAPRPASPSFLEGSTDGDYNYNAGRDPWRIGADALLNGDAVSAEQAGKVAIWANSETGGDPHKLRSGYKLSGTPLPGSDYFTTFFAAPIGVAAMLTDEQVWLDDIYEAVYDVQEDYFEDTVTLLCLLVMTGNFWAYPGP